MIAIVSTFSVLFIGLVVLWVRQGSLKRSVSMVEDLVLMYEQVNARQLALVQFLVENGNITSEYAVRIAEVETMKDVQRLLRERLDRASSELGETLNVRDFA